MRCLVPSCNRDFHHSEPNLSKHRFPENEERRLEWLKAVATVDKRVLNAKINFKVARICSDHFAPECFSSRAGKYGQARIILQKDAVPTIFIPRPNADYDSGSDGGGGGGGGDGNQIVYFDREQELTDEQIGWLKQKTAAAAALKEGTTRKGEPRVGPKSSVSRIVKTIRYPGDLKGGKVWSREQLSAALPKLQAKLSEREKSIKLLRSQNTRLRQRMRSMELYYEMQSSGGGPVPPMKKEPEPEGEVDESVVDNSDGFYDFLKSGKESSTFKPRKNKPETAVTKPGCSCDCCRKAHALKAIQERSKSTKSMQTDDLGPRPVATKIPFIDEVELLCCRLCFSVDDLEPLSYGTIVVRDEMLDKIYVSTGILVAPKPQKRFFICKACEKQINDFYIYRQLVYSNSRDFAVASRKTKPGGRPRSIHLPPPPRPADIRPVQAVLVKPEVTLRKVCPKVPMPKQEPPDDLDVVEIKSEPDDPLAESEVAILAPLSMDPAPVHIPVATPMETEPMEEQEELDEDESWSCWNCAETFRFQFECAKHLLLAHQEEVDTIKRRMDLDELNANMLEVMSLKK